MLGGGTEGVCRGPAASPFASEELGSGGRGGGIEGDEARSFSGELGSGPRGVRSTGSSRGSRGKRGGRVFASSETGSSGCEGAGLGGGLELKRDGLGTGAVCGTPTGFAAAGGAVGAPSGFPVGTGGVWRTAAGFALGGSERLRCAGNSAYCTLVDGGRALFCSSAT